MAHPEHLALWALAAGELDAEARVRVEAHVADCEACAQALEQVRQSRAVLQDARDVSPAMRTNVMSERLRSEAARRLGGSRPTVRWPWAVALAGTCAVLLVLWLVRAPAGLGGADGLVAERPAREAGSLPARGTTGRATTDVPDGTAHGEDVLPGGIAQAPPLNDEPTGGDTPPGERVAIVEAERTATSGAVIRETGGQERALAPGMRLRSGTAVRTPARSSAMLRLPDESRVRLSAGSEVELSRAESRDVHLTVKQGRLSVEASHAERHGFLVEAAGMRVSVVGTVFTVERTKDGAAVAVAEGQVRVEADGQPARLVSAGERLELHSQKHTLSPRKMSKPDLRAFAELREPAVTEPVRPSATRPVQKTEAPRASPDTTQGGITGVPPGPLAPADPPPTTPGAIAAATPGTQPPTTPEATSAVTPGTQPEAISAVTPGPSAPPPANALAPVGAAGNAALAPPAPVDPGQEFAPYPLPSVNPPRPPPRRRNPRWWPRRFRRSASR
ncbi:Vegetative cell wall protein gp1 precursor (Hydroxyproline-rich glycoprotein 1) [Myxococcus hansupus]|uniref:Vegetative cell wall protein gp1 (Hydroxyproline-rich glycoprotein 1) n=1 Tax=Pseudomyxococcus hansupus TaxID=1297742 RepID=A0A0H4X338_9BACT|nr:FecR domain-containing protein [Myxococcus hansupus]AKQ68055.1 Vegetative cell wall protein gp1 precursor (Hydroxyproline-rich glycoprotein 1) [Myxococcus hansupus]